MVRRRIRFWLSVLALVTLTLTRTPPAGAAGEASFTITVASAFLRNEPSLAAERTYSVFKDQTYGITGRNADNSWLRLDFPGAARGTWILATLGAVDGELNSVPVTAAAQPAPVITTSAPAPVSRSPSFATGVTFTTAVKSFYARSAPGYSSPRVKSLFKGEAYPVLARNSEGTWLRIDYPVARTEVWVPLSYGLADGDVDGLPVSSGGGDPGAAALNGPSSPVIPWVSARARAIYQQGLAYGNNPRAFSKVGDCQTIPPLFLTAYDYGDYRLGTQYAYLYDAIVNFQGSFARDSQAALYGMTARTVLDPIWANPWICQPGENALECEYRIQRPSLAVVSLGTNGQWDASETYEAAMRQIIETSIARGVLPILSTKADDVEGGGRFNAIVARLAAEYELPLWNFWLATRPLANYGVIDTYHLTQGPAYFDDPAYLQLGWPLRNLTALQALDAVWKAVR